MKTVSLLIALLLTGTAISSLCFRAASGEPTQPKGQDLKESERNTLAAEALAKCLPRWHDRQVMESGEKAKRKCGELAA